MLKDDGRFPNNESCPLLLYLQAVSRDPVTIEELFTRNSWPVAWRNGVFSFHHYHSTAHEVLGVYSGNATVQFGGDQGAVEEIRAGDVVVIPAGVAHKSLVSTGDFAAVGAYPLGQNPDMCYGKEGERPQSEKNIAVVPRPESDPVQGQKGAVPRIWPEP